MLPQTLSNAQKTLSGVSSRNSGVTLRRARIPASTPEFSRALVALCYDLEVAPEVVLYFRLSTRAIESKVNSPLFELDMNIDETWLLPHNKILCVIRYVVDPHQGEKKPH